MCVYTLLVVTVLWPYTSLRGLSGRQSNPAEGGGRLQYDLAGFFLAGCIPAEGGTPQYSLAGSVPAGGGREPRYHSYLAVHIKIIISDRP